MTMSLIILNASYSWQEDLITTFWGFFAGFVILLIVINIKPRKDNRNINDPNDKGYDDLTHPRHRGR